jgi:hypothetical protein
MAVDGGHKAVEGARATIRDILAQRGCAHLEPDCDYLTAAIDTWVYG